MFHNNGAYGPSGAPNNMGVPINRNIIPTQNTHHNLNHLGKLTQQPSQATSVHHNMGHMPNYGYPPVSPGIPNMFEHYSAMGYQTHYTPQNMTSLQDNWHSSMLPMHPSTNHVSNTNTLMNNRVEFNLNNDFRDQNINRRNTLLNIPQVQKRAQNDSTDNIYNFNSVSKYSNLDLSTKTSTLLDDDRRKSLENTVKLIENILIKSTTQNQGQITENDPLSLPSMESSKDAQREDESEDEPDNDAEDESQNDKDDENTSESQIECEQDTEDVKPDISELLLDDAKSGVVTKVMVKVEQTSWTDTEYSNPFDKDVNGVQRDNVGDCLIIESDNSVEQAGNVIKKESPANAYFECPHCTLAFNHPKRFMIHIKWHLLAQSSEKKVFRRNMTCEKEFLRSKKREAKVMERMEANEVKDPSVGKVHPCKDCDKMFSTKNSLKNHRQRTHPSVARNCKICRKTLTSWGALRRHLAADCAPGGVGPAGGPFQCPDCPKQFKYAQSLAKHRDTHLEKTHECPECPKKFGSPALVKMHQKTHERQQRGATYRCTYCGKGFFESYNLQVHERTHRNERPFTCDICNSSFGTNSSLKRHLRVSHSSTKPFECSTCHRSFVAEGIRDRHELRVHGDPEEFKFVCDQCPCRYMKSKDLQKHIYKVHPTAKHKKKPKSDSE